MKLIFVYNSDGTFASLIKDTAHKLTSPTTYSCNLCRLTYPIALMDKGWKKFIESLPYKVEFLHRDEFHKQYPDQKRIKLPAVFKEDPSVLRLLISHDEINKAQNIQELIKLVEHLLPKQNQ